ncbi:MAG: cell envelope integrity protein CreD [Woeseiaceae bacterium]
MQNVIDRLQRSTSLKATIIAVLILVLLIPIAMIRGVIDDRMLVSSGARADIMRSWGSEQLVAGPILVVPGEIVRSDGYGQKVEETLLHILPEQLDFDAVLYPEVRYRGLHKFPVYRAELRISGTFTRPALEGLRVRAEALDWAGAFMALAVTDARAITATPSLELGGRRVRFAAGGQKISAFPPQIVAPVGALIAASEAGTSVPFELVLALNGTDSLRFLPLGDTTGAAVRSTWPSPSFGGDYLPQSREVTDGGFSARWEVSSLGRALPSLWLQGAVDQSVALQSAFGVTLYMPVGLYQQTLRATKYAVLFIGLSFVAYFLFETLGALQLHPLQYLLVGFANALFYLLLLSLAEHTGFGPAYLASAVASTLLIAGYSRAVLGRTRSALLMGLVLAALYAFLYLILQAEDYAMLAGALGLWVVLAAIMYLTRRIDWYGPRGES